MLAFDQKSMEAFTAPAREMFEAWISFFPTAPLFGVPWRFAPDVSYFSGDLAAPMSFPWAVKLAQTDSTEFEIRAEDAEDAEIVTATDDGGSIEQIRGIGPRLAAELKEMGITSIAQIAALTDTDLARIDAELTTIKGRCYRDDWVGQAKAILNAA